MFSSKLAASIIRCRRLITTTCACARCSDDQFLHTHFNILPFDLLYERKYETLLARGCLGLLARVPTGRRRGLRGILGIELRRHIEGRGRLIIKIDIPVHNTDEEPTSYPVSQERRDQ